MLTSLFPSGIGDAQTVATEAPTTAMKTVENCMLMKSRRSEENWETWSRNRCIYTVQSIWDDMQHIADDEMPWMVRKNWIWRQQAHWLASVTSPCATRLMYSSQLIKAIDRNQYHLMCLPRGCFGVSTTSLYKAVLFSAGCFRVAFR